MKRDLLIRAIVALALAVAAQPATYLTLGAGRVLYVELAGAVALAALVIFGMGSAGRAVASRGGPAFTCLAIGLVSCAGLSAFAHDWLAALACAGVALHASFAAAFDVGRGKLGAMFGLGSGAATGFALVQAMRIEGLSVFVLALAFLPLIADAALTAARGKNAQFVFEIGRDAGVSRKHIGWAYWLISTHCALLALAAGEAGRRAALRDVSALDALGQKLNLAASLAPIIAFAVMALVLLRISSQVRAFAARKLQ